MNPVKYGLILQCIAAMYEFALVPSAYQFNEMSTTEIDYATEILRAWKRVCEGTSPAAVRSVEYWGSLYCASRFDGESSGDGHLDADASAELSWAESVLGGSEGALEES